MRGIGREMAREFHSLGSKVAVNYNSSRKEAEELKKELGSGVESSRPMFPRRAKLTKWSTQL